MDTITTQNNIATDLFYKIRSRFSGLKLGSATGEITILPEEARFFDFDYMEGENPIGHVSISLAEPNSMKIYFSHGITENMDPVQKKNWYSFLKELRVFAKRRLLSFDTRDIAKDNLDKRDYNFLSKNAIDNTIGESVMKESSMYGTNKTSYQKLLDTRLIIKHNKTLQDDSVPGARSRNISALFVENEAGERFKYPFVHLAGARAMQRHVANGGLPYDEIGESIINMSEEIAQLKSFSNYVVRNDLMNSDTNAIVERGTSALTELRNKLAKISKQKHYDAYKESFQARQAEVIPEDIVQEFTEKFTVKNFNEKIKEAFPIIYRLMKEDNISRDEVVDCTHCDGTGNGHNDRDCQFCDGHGKVTRTKQKDESIVDYDDILEMTKDEENAVEENKEVNPLEDFESWVIGLGEDNALISSDHAEQTAAVKTLHSLVSEHFPVGVDGINAIESIKGIIDDPQLYSQIKEMAESDAEADVRPLIQGWIQEHAPEVLNQLKFSEMDDTQVNADESVNDNETGKLNVQEVAEFIHSFYDKESKTFPKGPEGVCTMVGKRFGEHAENAARRMVERLAPQQRAGSELEEDPLQQPEQHSDEMARMRKLSGL